MNGWSLLSGERQEAPTVVSLEDESVRADLRNFLEAFQELYWHAPSSYLGDQVSSYGGYLRYQLHSDTRRGDVFIPVESWPDVILKGNQMSIMFLEGTYPTPGEVYEGQLQLLEDNFRHTETHNPVSREELMMVLANLEQLQIRALFSQISSSVSLHQVTLERAIETGGGIQASNVELCMCPANYRGDSCQICQVDLDLQRKQYQNVVRKPGQKLAGSLSLSGSESVIAAAFRNVLQAITGIPRVCSWENVFHVIVMVIQISAFQDLEYVLTASTTQRVITVKDARMVLWGTLHSVDLCSAWDAPVLFQLHLTTLPLDVCKEALPLNVFASLVTLEFHVNALLPYFFFQSCAPGYYGNPLVIGSSCQPCDCSGNADPNMLFSDCDSLTGFCTGCMYNTAGPRCEVCAPGFYGDAVVAKNCTDCNCLSCGTESCDPRTGQCHCKPGVTGQHCDRCQEGHYGYETCLGCQRCDCDIGSVSRDCHAQNGQCRCNPGVSGSRCQQCTPGYWGLGTNGCSKCHCKGGSCNPRTGECTCTNGLTGKQCDSCIKKYEIPVVDGPDNMRCEGYSVSPLWKPSKSCIFTLLSLTACDSCVLLLLEDLQKIESSFPALRHQLTSLNATSIAWTRLHSINGSMQAITNHLREYQNSLNRARQQADELEEENTDFVQDLNALQHKATMTNRKAIQVTDSTEENYQQADNLVQDISKIQNKINDLVCQMDIFTTANASSTSTEEFRRKMAEVDAMLRHMKTIDFDFPRATAIEEHDDARKLLDHVKTELFSKLESNQELVSHIDDQLDQYSSELMDLRDALNEAVNKTRQTEDLNSLNRNHLEETQQKRKTLKEQYSEIQNTLQLAEESLAQVSDFLQIVEDVKEESEKLAAQLDGARYPLSEKAKEYSLASNKIPVVEKAEGHAKLLDELAKNLSSIIHGTNQDGFIQRAINASNAYASIIAAIKDAESAANEAKSAAGEALTNVILEDLGTSSKEMKNNSIALEEAGKKEQRKLNKDIKGALQAARNRLTGIQTKKEDLLNQLQSVKITLDMVQDGTAEAIQSAKDAASEANETVARMEVKLSDMQKNLNEWNQQYGDLKSEDLNQAVQDAKNTVSSLESTLPLLLGKLSNLENRRSHNATVSENILRVRQLISLARNAVSKIKVPVKFNGTSGVQIRTPSNLHDLAAYTSLKFYIQNPEPKPRQERQNGDDLGRFVLYLGHKDAVGDYMGVILKDRKVQWIYKLGTEEPAHLTVDEEIGEQFAAVSINRILQYGHMSVTVEKQTLHETKGDSVAKGEQGLFNFKPHNVVFYVGGYPSSFTPPTPLRYPNYRGCIEMDTLNEEVMSLYNFQSTFHLDTAAERPCTRSKSTGDPWLTDGSYFDGTGYAEITFERQISLIKRFEQELRLVSYNGILFFLKHEASRQLLCLAVQKGKLVLYYDFNDGLKVAATSKDPTALLVGSNTNKAVMTEKRPFCSSVAGLNLKKIFPKGGSIRGCMKGLKALGRYVDLKRMNTTGVSYGCTLDLLVARSVKFHGHGFLTLALRNVPSLQDFYTGFSFRTSQSRGLMYYHDTEEGTCQVSLQNGRVAVSLLTTELTTKNAYADDKSHYIAIYSDSSGIRVYIDDQLQGTKPRPDHLRRQKRQDETSDFQLGGMPKASEIGNLTGCIGNVFVRRTSEPQMVVDLQQSTESFNVTMNCPRDRQPQQMRASEKKGRWKPKVPSKKILKDTNCHLLKYPKAIKDTFQFGSYTGSRLEFDDIPATFQERFHFSMEVKMNSSSGLLFYMTDASLSSFFSVFVSNGHFVLLADIGGRKLRLRSKDKYHDEKWHTVFFSRDRNRVQLVIDGLRALEKSLPTDGDLWIPILFYVGGAPVEKAKTHIPDASATSFKGCLRHLKLDRKPLVSPSRIFGVTPCYVGPLENGIFFSAEGGYVTLDRSVAIGQDFELMLEIRPRSASGLIFHIGTKRTNYLRLYSDSQKVIVIANTGAGEFSTFVAQPSLCDGQWHTIAVMKGSNVIQLDVDTEGNYTVGPNQTDEAAVKENFYLGGMPEFTSFALASPLHIAHFPSYVGCMRNVVINRNQIDLRQARTRGSVGLNGCPVM
ncbi:hypothetical protein JD844_019053 [Phrynosoma platyrhinos]|uniref:Laminin subunit alpha 5 n=1 Tax=Phrynosoma platyrhinos TaxID=52577 RepID=A0ABQ7SPE5_PHRPL|nr:hypothetical protein JD844_019053 [Phrynosoma platyrhinos]